MWRSSETRHKYCQEILALVSTTSICTGTILLQTVVNYLKRKGKKLNVKDVKDKVFHLSAKKIIIARFSNLPKRRGSWPLGNFISEKQCF